MFINHVESWLDGKDTHVVDYIQGMLDNGYITLTDFQNEIKVLTAKMELCSPKYTVEYMFIWSIRDYIKECLRWYVPEGI